jgi:hypothetical protein
MNLGVFGIGSALYIHNVIKDSQMDLNIQQQVELSLIVL